MKKILVIGGAAGGASAAVRLRRLSEKNTIILFEKEAQIALAGCALPYYISGVVTRREDLEAYTEANLKSRFNIDVRTQSEVVAIHPEEKNVVVSSDGREYSETYDCLIIATGGRPVIPTIKGIEEANNVYTIDSLPDADRIKVAAEACRGGSVIVVGGSYVGLEMAESFRRLNLKVTVVEKGPQVLAGLDFEMAQIVHRELNANSVSVILNDGVSSIENNGKTVALESGRRLQADMLFFATGITAENHLARQAGFKLSERGFIITTGTFAVLDAETMTPVDGVYAVGNAVQVQGFVTRTGMDFALAGPASRQGRLVADHLAGLPIDNAGVQGTSVLKIFTKTVGVTGAQQEMLEKRHIAFQEVIVHANNHPAYYPGAEPLTLKLLYDVKTLKILAAQAVGGEGTDKRLDVLATAMRLGATIRNLTSLELSCAPPYASVKDPVNILGYAAVNISDGIYKTVTWDKIDSLIQMGGFLLDVRGTHEYAKGHLEGAVNIPLDTLRDAADSLPEDTTMPIYVYCSIGRHAYTAIRILRGFGYKTLYALSGGYATYCDAHYTVH